MNYSLKHRVIFSSMSFILLLSTNIARAQESPVPDKKEYLSIVAESFKPISNRITSSGDRKLLRNYNVPGVSIGVDYTRISKSGFTIITGLHYHILPISYRFNIKKEEFDVSDNWQNDFILREADYAFGDFNIPLRLGYTLQETRGRWEPAVTLGLNINHLGSFGYEGNMDYAENFGAPEYPAFAIIIESPEKDHKISNRIWPTYNLNARLSKTLQNGNQINMGLTANISTLVVQNGEYEFYLKSGTEGGTYRNKGSYIGIEFGYSFLKKKPRLSSILTDGKYRKSLFVEVLGSGGILSANFDRRFRPDRNDGFGFRIGVGETQDGMTFPLGVNYIAGKKRNGFESGIGLTPLYGSYTIKDDSKGGALGFLNMGYRFQAINKGLIFRLNWAPVFDTKEFYPGWAGLSLGYSFK